MIGRVFAETLAVLGGHLRIEAATACVFSPNPVPDDYLGRARIPLLLRPGAFVANAIDVAGLFDHVSTVAKRYPQIAAPTVVVSGDADTVVYEEIHSEGLARDIPGAELVWVRNLGHKPDWIAADLAVTAIEKVAGLDRDLTTAARAVEARVSQDRQGVGICEDPKAPSGEPELKPAQ